MYKLTFVLLVVGVAVAMCQPVPNDTIYVPPAVVKTETTQLQLQPQPQPQLQQQQNKPTVGQIVDHLTDAARLTLQEERGSIAKTLDSLREAGGKGVRAGLDAAKTGLDLLLVVPKFGRNVIAGSAGKAGATATATN